MDTGSYKNVSNRSQIQLCRDTAFRKAVSVRLFPVNLIRSNRICAITAEDIAENLLGIAGGDKAVGIAVCGTEFFRCGGIGADNDGKGDLSIFRCEPAVEIDIAVMDTGDCRSGRERQGCWCERGGGGRGCRCGMAHLRCRDETEYQSRLQDRT